MLDLEAFLAALRAGGVTVYPLLALAVIAAVVVLEKSFVVARRTWLPVPLVDLVETYGFNWSEVDKQVVALGGRNYFGGFFPGLPGKPGPPPGGGGTPRAGRGGV